MPPALTRAARPGIALTVLLLAAVLAAACAARAQHRPDSEPARPAAATVAGTPGPAPSSGQAASPDLARAASPGCGLARTPGDAAGTMDTPWGEREWRIHIPPGYDPGDPLPLVLNFHGSGRTALEQEEYSGLVPIADREGFILVTPEGTGADRGWDIPGVYHDDGVDDVAFAASLLDLLEGETCIDTGAVFATGHSNGAEMASLLACQLPQRIAAVAAVSGVEFGVDGCKDGPVAILAFHGTFDENVPFETAPEAMAAWAAHNGCGEEPVIEQVSEDVERWSYPGCTAPVVLYVIAGGGHTWPGAADDSFGAGPTTHEIDASEIAWAFFREVSSRR